jgi:hypothetical protein
MKDCYGMSGWRQFLQNRRNILCEVDKLLEQISYRPIKTAHGDAGEAKIREWLTEFLPKKYGVTSGYIIPNLFDDQETQYHFDIIIYDALEAPTLWVEGNNDHSNQGKSKAIPAEYVKAVYEVKARITLKSTREAIEKLKQLNAFKEKLAVNFNCALIFIDLNEKDLNRQSILKTLLGGKDIFGFWGGTILRCSIDDTATALIDFFSKSGQSEILENDKSPLMRPINEASIVRLEDGSVQLRGGGGAVFTSNGVDKWYVTKQYSKTYTDLYSGVILNWSRSGFADFSIKLLGALDGKKPNSDKGSKALSFGRVFDYLEREEALPQAGNVISGMPFFHAGLIKNKDSDNYLDITESEDGAQISFTFDIENKGEIEADMTTNSFKDFITIPKGKSGKCHQSYLAQTKDKSLDEIRKLGEPDYPFSILQKFVYRISSNEVNNQWRFFSLKAKFDIYKDSYSVTIED